MNLKHLSDEELDKAIEKEKTQVSNPSALSQLSDEQLDSLISVAQSKEAPKEQSMLDQAKEAALYVGSLPDRYLGAPTRSGIGAIQEGNNPLSAYANQFGEEPALAPTGKEIAQRAGVSDRPIVNPSDVPSMYEDPEAYKAMRGLSDVSRSGAVGLGIDIGADPTNLIPLAAAGRAGIKGGAILGKAGLELGEQAAKGLGKASLNTAERVAPTVTSTVKKTAENIAKSLSRTLSPKIRPEFEQDVVTAMTNGIDPSMLTHAHQYGPESTITKLGQLKRQGPLGESDRAAFQEGLNQTREAVDKEIATFSKGQAPLDQTSAGQLIRDSYNGSIDDLFSENSTRYSTIVEHLPDAKLSKEAGVELATFVKDKKTDLTKKLKFASTAERPELKATLEDLDVIQENLKTGDLSTAIDQMQAIGRTAFKKAPPVAGIAPVDKKLLKEIYGKMKVAIINSTEDATVSHLLSIGEDAVKAKDIASGLKRDLVKSNENIASFLKDNAIVDKTLTTESIAPERVYTNIIESGDTTKIKALKSIFAKDPDALNQLKATYLENLKILDKDGGFSFARLNHAIRNDPKVDRVMKTLFEPNELKNFNDLVDLGERFGQPILNQSGTEVSRSFKDIGAEFASQAIGDQVVNAFQIKAARDYAIQQALKPIESLDDAIQKPGFFDGMSMQPTKEEIALKALRVASAQHQNQIKEERKPIAISLDLIEPVTTSIKDSDTSSITKAKMISEMNQTGKIGDLTDLFKQDNQQIKTFFKGNPKPKQDPLNTKNVSDFVNSRREVSY